MLYLAVIGSWLIIEATPGDPIGDPYLWLMEWLTIASAVALVTWVSALRGFPHHSRSGYARTTCLVAWLAAGLTTAVHFVQLSAVRQLWSNGALPDYRLVWPSLLLAAEYLAWDVLVGFTMLFAGLTLRGVPRARAARAAFVLGGALCLTGALGPLTGHMAAQNVAVFGYAVVLPIAAALSVRLFYRTPADG